MRDIDDEAIKSLPVEYEPQTVKEAFDYIHKHRQVAYLSINFDLNVANAFAIDFGSHTEFCYLWDLTSRNMEEFAEPMKVDAKEDFEEAEKKRFALKVLWRLKQMQYIPYDVAVAIDKMLKDE